MATSKKYIPFFHELSDSMKLQISEMIAGQMNADTDVLESELQKIWSKVSCRMYEEFEQAITYIDCWSDYMEQANAQSIMEELIKISEEKEADEQESTTSEHRGGDNYPSGYRD